jgi:hypothetical protein
LIEDIIGFANKNYRNQNLTPELTVGTLAAIEVGLRELKRHLLEAKAEFFGDDGPLLYGPGKEMFHEFVNLLNDERIPLQTRMNAIQSLAAGVQTCAGKVLTTLRTEVSNLKGTTSGLKGTAQRMKIMLIDSLVLQHVKDNHTYLPGNEVHYVNAYVNYLAHDMGIPERLDPFVSIAAPEYQ